MTKQHLRGLDFNNGNNNKGFFFWYFLLRDKMDGEDIIINNTWQVHVKKRVANKKKSEEGERLVY